MMGSGRSGAGGLVSTDVFIFSVLLLINALMAVAMLLASRTLGQPRVACLLAAAFGGNVLMYLIDAIYFFQFRGNLWLNAVLSILAMIPVIFAASAYRLRAGLPPRRIFFIMSVVGATLLVLLFSFVMPLPGPRGAIVPIFAAAMLLFGITAMWRPGRTLLLGERPIIITGCAMAAIEMMGGIVLAANVDGTSEALREAYTLIVFLGLPAMTAAAGVFSLYMLAGDLAERLRIAAETDSLTGAPNRRAIEANGARLMQEALSRAQPLSLAICDVDHFKEINDQRGHGRGDDVLRQLATLFREHVTAADHYGRFGGEEFILLFPSSDAGDAHRRVEVLRDRIMDLRIDEQPAGLTASFGVTTACDDDRTLADVIARADRALYASKQAGRNRTTIDRQADLTE